MNAIGDERGEGSHSDSVAIVVEGRGLIAVFRSSRDGSIRSLKDGAGKIPEWGFWSGDRVDGDSMIEAGWKRRGVGVRSGVRRRGWR
jgi:hypothetical protein